MESIEFLGGRYNRPEQIMSGPVQAFRAQSAATGKTVFIHRVSTTESPEEQAALLKLLTLALVKSSEAKRLVLDFGEERSDWYVVTESEAQCALLREWLQLEIDALSRGPRSSSANRPLPAPMRPPLPKPTEPAVTADPGEFTRFLQSRPAVTSNPESSAPPPTPPPTPPPQPKTPEPKASPGEFSRFFNPGDATPSLHPQVPAPIPMIPQKPALVPPPFVPPSSREQIDTEAGTFTRFFTPGLPAVPPKPTQPAVPDRVINNPHVQRPTPPVRPAPDPQPVGEFTRLFSDPQGKQPPAIPQPKRSDPMEFSSREMNQPAAPMDDLFSDTIDVGKPMPPSARKPEGDFTKVFGSMGAEAPLMRGPSAVAPRNDKPLLDERGPKNDPLRESPRLPPIQPQLPANPPSENSPANFTEMMKGSAPASSTAKPATAPNQGSSSLPPLNFQPPSMPIPPRPPMPPRPVLNNSISPAGASASSPFGSLNVSAPPLPQAHVPLPAFALSPVKANANKKLIIFFVLLAVLAIALILVILFVMKNK